MEHVSGMVVRSALEHSFFIFKHFAAGYHEDISFKINFENGKNMKNRGKLATKTTNESQY